VRLQARSIQADSHSILGSIALFVSAQPSAEVKSERDLQDLIAEYLRMKSIVAIRSRMDKKMTVPVGTPDFLFRGSRERDALRDSARSEDSGQEAPG
jgi:hypothetical protein